MIKRSVHFTHSKRVRTVLATTALGTAVLFAASGCSNGGTLFEQPAAAEATASAPASSAAPAAPTASGIPSVFSEQGSVQLHQAINGIDYVLTLWPTRATPNPSKWYPKGKKYFNLTFTSYDEGTKLRAKFSKKRKVYLSRVQISSTTVGANDTDSSTTPYWLDTEARKVTLDPDAVHTSRGMRITSPKGSFEIRNQAIGSLNTGATGVKLKFVAYVSAQSSAGSKHYDKEVIKQTIPIAITPSTERTKAKSIPFDAN